jgi:hypothetical protein
VAFGDTQVLLAGEQGVESPGIVLSMRPRFDVAIGVMADADKYSINLGYGSFLCGTEGPGQNCQKKKSSQ